jgi:hypothetical protein
VVEGVWLMWFRVGMGTAGYGDDKWSIGQSYGQEPVYSPAVYKSVDQLARRFIADWHYSYNAAPGSRFTRQGLSDSVNERMYHSSAVLLADGAVLVSGSNPNKDVTYVQWGTSYVVEKWYPLWYNEARPVASGFPSSLSYVS